MWQISVAGCDDAGGFLGRRHRHRGHRPSGTQHPPEFLFSTTDFNSYVTVSTADGAPQRVNGRMAAPRLPGLGIQPKMAVLGKHVVVVE